MNLIPAADDVCMRFPLSLLCALDNRLGVHSDDRSWRCNVHDLALRLAYRLHWRVQP